MPNIKALLARKALRTTQCPSPDMPDPTEQRGRNVDPGQLEHFGARGNAHPPRPLSPTQAPYPAGLKMPADRPMRKPRYA